jgi:hypothetical protein
MRRRWIAAGLVLVALVATLAVLLPGRAEEPFPPVVWYCAASGEVRETSRGATRPDLSAVPTVRTASSEHAFATAVGGPSPSNTILVFTTPSLARRAIAWITRSAMQARTYRATGTVETADGRSWEKLELHDPFALPR